ncbi:MAG: hypothetical protein LBF59_02655 [Prevotellaceae bacterium]|jgi:hypothetical protein|nr:hypothetical protein [Prevotellaceae bacterium]
MDSINVLGIVYHTNIYIKETIINILNRSFEGFECRRVWQTYDTNGPAPETKPPLHELKEVYKLKHIKASSLIIQAIMQGITGLACPYIVVCGCVKKTQMPKGERVGLQFNLFQL